LRSDEAKDYIEDSVRGIRNCIYVQQQRKISARVCLEKKVQRFFQELAREFLTLDELHFFKFSVSKF
jgi:hypothetical protein